MNRADLVSHVAAAAELPKAAADKAVSAVFDGITAALAGGDEVTVYGFGVFSVSQRPERDGRNPKTGEALKIPAGKSLKFRPSKQLKIALQDA